MCDKFAGLGFVRRFGGGVVASGGGGGSSGSGGVGAAFGGLRGARGGARVQWCVLVVWVLVSAVVSAGVGAPAAQAQQQRQEVFWSATLTVDFDDDGARAGCSDSRSDMDDCSLALSDTVFRVGVKEYTVTDIIMGIGASSEGAIGLDFKTGGTGSADPLPIADRSDPIWAATLEVDGEGLAFENDLADCCSIFWSRTSVGSWGQGQQVRVRLVGPAQAAPYAVWSATLTVGHNNAGSITGCDNDEADLVDCSSALSDPTFVYAGIDTTFVWFSHYPNSNNWSFNFKDYVQESLIDDLTLRIDDKSWPLKPGNYGSVQSNQAKEWFLNSGNSGLSWSVGQQVKLSLVTDSPVVLPEPPSGLVQSGGSASGLSLRWTAPGDPPAAAVTGYEVSYRHSSAPTRAATVAGDPATGWVTKRVGRTTSTAVSGLAENNAYYVRVRALNRHGAGPWSRTVLETVGAAPERAAAPLRLLSASRTSVTEGATVTVTIRLARNAGSDLAIPLVVEGTAGAGDYTLSSSTIAVAAGQRSGSVTLTVVDDSDAEGAEFLYITPDIRTARGNSNTANGAINEVVPDSGAAAYQVASVRIDIAASDQPPAAAPTTPAGDPPPVGSTVGGADPGIPSGTRSTYDTDNSGGIDRSELVKAARKLAEGEIDMDEYQHVAVCVLRPDDCN